MGKRRLCIMRRLLRSALSVLLALTGQGALGANDAGEIGYSAAAGSVIVNPAEGAFLAGYGRDRRATGVLDDISVKAAVIGVENELLVLLSIDCIGLTRPDILQIQKGIAASLPQAHVVVSSTHTHAGPDVVGLWGAHLWRSGRDDAYMTILVDRAVRLAIEVAGQRRPAVSRVASVSAPFDWVENRSEPELLDQRLAVLQMLDDQGQSIVTLTNYACHPTVLDGHNTLVSADYAAGFYRAMADALPGEHMFLQGAIGGWVQPLQAGSSYNRALALGESLADAAQQALQVAQPNPATGLGFRDSVVDIPLENWGFRLMMWLGVLDRPSYDGAMRTSVATFRVGNARFMTHPGETSPAYSFASRQLADVEHTFILGLTQDAIGYILKPDYFAEEATYPHAEYLKSVSVGPEAGPRIMSVLHDLLEGAEYEPHILE